MILLRKIIFIAVALVGFSSMRAMTGAIHLEAISKHRIKAERRKRERNKSVYFYSLGNMPIIDKWRGGKGSNRTVSSTPGVQQIL